MLNIGPWKKNKQSGDQIYSLAMRQEKSPITCTCAGDGNFQTQGKALDYFALGG